MVGLAMGASKKHIYRVQKHGEASSGIKESYVVWVYNQDEVKFQ